MIYFDGLAYWADMYEGAAYRLRDGDVRENKQVLFAFPVRENIGTRAAWDEIREKVYALFPDRSNLAHGFWKQIRGAAIASRQKGWEQTLPKSIVEWAWKVLLEEAKATDPCVDNYRVAQLGRSSQMRRYRKQEEHGCCGSYNFTAQGPDGNKYMLGFNYGH